jgi:NTE family protein
MCNMTEAESKDGPRTVVVIAGAVARGAYEAGALAQLLPRFVPHLRNTVFIGTSAGAINATLWARFAQKGRATADIGADVMAVWRAIEDPAVFAPLLPTLLTNGLKGLAGFLSGAGLKSLLDTSPLRETVTGELHPESIARNIDERSLRGVGVVATACGKAIAGARSHVFLQYQEGRLVLPPTSDGSSIDYYAEPLTVDHVLASSAVPTLFQPVRIDVPEGSSRKRQFYVDGGVRLNTPIKPAIALGADQIIVVSSHAARYADNEESPDTIAIDDSIALILHSLLADGMIEDLRRLRDINHLVARAAREGAPTPTNDQGRPYKKTRLIVVAPRPGQLAREARRSLDKLSRFRLHAARYRLVDTLFRGLGAGSGRDELLSYLFFDRDYSDAQLALGAADAAQVSGWEDDIA